MNGRHSFCLLFVFKGAIGARLVVTKVALSHTPIAVSCLDKRIYRRVFFVIVYLGIVDWKVSGNPLFQRANLKVSQNIGILCYN